MNHESHSVAIVGGGVAGSSLAITLARAGLDVVVLEKETEFRDRVRGEFLAPWAVADLRRLGLLDTMTRAGAIELPALAGRSLKPRPIRTPGGDVPLSFSHTDVQEALISEAAAAGATVVRGARVLSVLASPAGQVVVNTAEGARTISARLVVGADGRTSLVRRALGRREQVRRSDRVLAGVRLSQVPADPSSGYFIIREDMGGVVSLFPQAGGMARAYVFLYGQDGSEYRGEGGFRRFLDAMVRLGVPREAIAGAQPAGPLASFVADDSWVDHPAASGLALVGDAAGISDPTWGQGLALAFHDARVLSDALLSQKDWDVAVHQYAHQRDTYFSTIITAEQWLTDLQLTPGPEAAARRSYVMQAWRSDPSRADGLDLNGRGPALDTSDDGRRRVFAEDPLQAIPGAGGIADAFLAAIRARDFDGIARAFTGTARFRALLPGGPREFHGAAAAAEIFAHWFGGVEEFEVITTNVDVIADRLRLSWRIRLRWEGEPFSRVIEQQGYAKMVDGHIAVMDLLCSGFRPEQPRVAARAA